MKTPHTGGAGGSKQRTRAWAGGGLNRPYRKDLRELKAIERAEKGFGELIRFLLGC